ncbi:MORC family CW-type zinc finger protein 3 [Acetobacter orientalis]|uniref:MORC family CW-type zinc finger protein 3 n=1 Tax=Acetobacter orientalis TaxID=146474 RepID=A0A2Z5ZHH0_9PROT|nr:MORC family CW-type zinc finger protein 3 [Acetobacter orientalis]
MAFTHTPAHNTAYSATTTGFTLTCLCPKLPKNTETNHTWFDAAPYLVAVRIP